MKTIFVALILVAYTATTISGQEDNNEEFSPFIHPKTNLGCRPGVCYNMGGCDPCCGSWDGDCNPCIPFFNCRTYTEEKNFHNEKKFSPFIHPKTKQWCRPDVCYCQGGCDPCGGTWDCNL